MLGRECLVSDFLAGDRKTANLFYSVEVSLSLSVSSKKSTSLTSLLNPFFPICLFYSVLSVITINVPVVYNGRNDFDGGKSISRPIGRGGPWKSILIGPWNANERRECHSGPPPPPPPPTSLYCPWAIVTIPLSNTLKSPNIPKTQQYSICTYTYLQIHRKSEQYVIGFLIKDFY